MQYFVKWSIMLDAEKVSYTEQQHFSMVKAHTSFHNSYHYKYIADGGCHEGGSILKSSLLQ